MRRAAYMAVLILLLTLCLFTSFAPASGNEVGKSLYENKCQLCHGSTGEGNGPAATALSPKPADFRNPAFWKNTTRAKMENAIQNGKGVMPAFPLNRDDLTAVIDYISHTFKPGQ